MLKILPELSRLLYLLQLNMVNSQWLQETMLCSSSLAV